MGRARLPFRSLSGGVRRDRDGMQQQGKDAAGDEGAIVKPLDVPHGGVSFEEFKEFVEGVGDQVELCDATLAGFRT